MTTFQYNDSGFRETDIRYGYTRIDKKNRKGKVIQSFAVTKHDGETYLYVKEKDNSGTWYLKRVFIKNRSDFLKLVNSIPKKGDQLSIFG